jgi:acyl-CoA synthetase (AMP-forming)/AMP-acid ligase II
MQSRQVFPLSMSFTAGIPAHILPHLYVGGTTYLMKDWDTERLVDAIDELQASFTIMPGPPIVQFTEVVKARGTRLPSLVSVLHSTSKAPDEHLELLVDTIGPRLVEGWGMTENSGGLAAATTAADYITRRPGIFSSTGRPSPDSVVRVVDENGEILPQDGSTVGQLVFHSGSLARGYWQNPEATAKSFIDGWYQSGDLGFIDPEGYITILDRRNDLILSGGMNVYPSEIERIVVQVEGVAEVAVVAGSHERWGQTPVAFVRVSDPAVSVETILAYCRERLAGYKLPTDIRFIDELPKNASGKVLKQELRADIEKVG